MKRIISMLFMLFMLLMIFIAVPGINAPEDVVTIGPFEQSECGTLTQSCDNCTSINVTAITLPNNTVEIINRQMEKNDTFYNLTFCLTDSLGNYIYNGVGDVDGLRTVFSVNFRVGIELTSAQAIIYLTLTVIVFAIFLLSLWLVVVIPYGNKSNPKGDIIAITKTKYLKVGMVLITYGLFVWLLNLVVALSAGIVVMNPFFAFFSMIFMLFMRLSLPVFIFIFVWFIWMTIRDVNIWKWMQQ